MIKPAVLMLVKSSPPSQDLHIAASAQSSPSDSHPVIAVIGSTGSGKSQLGVEISAHLAAKSPGLGSAILSCDSMQLYQSLPVITNQPTVEELQAVPHHLVSCLPVGEEYDVGQFCQEAKRRSEELLRRGDVPLLVGGTTYYVQHLLFPGKVVEERATRLEPSSKAAPAEDRTSPSTMTPELQTAVRGLSLEDQETWQLVLATPPKTLPAIAPTRLWSLLEKLDAPMAARWHPQDGRKIFNSLRVIADTGKRHSDFVREQEVGSSEADDESVSISSPQQWADRPIRVLLLWVWADRPVLNRRLDARVEKMITRGLFKEIRELRELDELLRWRALDQQRSEADTTKGVFQAIGYKEFVPFLDALDETGLTEGNGGIETLPLHLQKLFERGLDEMRTATRQYAKKQVQWMKNKLLPEIKKRRNRGEEVHVLLLDSSQVEQWETQVRKPALEAVDCFLAGHAMPDSSLQCEAAKTELLPFLETSSADGMAIDEADVDDASSLSANMHILCQVCTDSKLDRAATAEAKAKQKQQKPSDEEEEEEEDSTSEAATAPVYYRLADKEKHHKGKTHRYAEARMRNKALRQQGGALPMNEGEINRKREERATRRREVEAATLAMARGDDP